MDNENRNHSVDAFKVKGYEQFRDYERFTFLMQHMSRAMSTAKSVLDIGCAKGEFMYLLKEKYPHVAYTGVEINAELLDVARQEPCLKDVTFIQGDARDFSLDEKFDVVVMSGVLSIFDDFEKPLYHMFEHTVPGGRGFIFGAFNEQDIDVLVRYRNNVKGSTSWESGLNLFSLKTIERYMKEHVTLTGIEHFELQRDLPRSSNPIVSYTVKTEDHTKMIVTGANIICDFFLVSYQK